jgi:hypothetical protein
MLSNSQASVQNKTGYLIREWLGDYCPACTQRLRDHEYARLGVVVKDSAAEAAVLEAFRRHQWSDIRKKEFTLSLDALLGNVLRCPGGRLVWFVTFEPYDPLSSPYYVVESEVLDTAESGRLNAVIRPEEWRRFPGGLLVNRRVLASKFIRTRKRLWDRLQSWLRLQNGR